MRKAFIPVLLSILLALGSAAVNAGDEGEQPTIAEASGKVHVLRGGDEAKTQPASVGLVLENEDVVKTGTDSSATIKVGSGNMLRLEANSELKAASIAGGPQLNLLGGKLLNRLKAIPKGKKVVIGTPTSIAGIEGTTFAIAVSDNGQKTEVDVLSGTVRVQSLGEPNKFANVTEMLRVQVSNWKDTVFVATGTAVAPERYKRPRVLDEGKEVFVVRATGIGKPAPGLETDEERAASAQDAAMTAALRALGDRILRVKINEEKTIADVAAENRVVYNKIAALLAGAVRKSSSTLDDGSVEVEVEVATDDLNAALGLEEPAFTSAMVRLGPTKYAEIFSVRARLTAEHAAKTVADRELLETIQGVMIDSETTIQDFVLQDDRVASTVEGVIRGAETVRTLYFSDGTVEVTRQVRGSDVRIEINALTEKETLGTHYMGRPTMIDPTWYETLRRFDEP